jgi:hemerythrin-like domain-containing protein
MEINHYSEIPPENVPVIHHDYCAMPTFTTFRSFEALDNCHQQIQQKLDELTALVKQLASGNAPDVAARTQAKTIETFFSTVARGHHAAEEQEVFPVLLMSDDTALVAQVRSLIEDHFWIEKYWHDLSPMLTRIGQGAALGDSAEFGKAVGLFLDLCLFHIEEEESMIYPEAKAQVSKLYGTRVRPGTPVSATP